MIPTSNRQKQEFHFTLTTSATAIDALAANTPLSKQKLKDAMQKGAVWLQNNNHPQRLRRAKKMLPSGSEVHLYYDQTLLAISPEAPMLIHDAQAYSTIEPDR